MGYTMMQEHANRFHVRGYGQMKEYSNRFFVRGLGWVSGLGMVDKNNFGGALVYFEKKGSKVDGSFYVHGYNVETGEVILLPHWEDYDAVVEQLKSAFGVFWGFGSGIEKTPQGVKFTLKDPENYFKYWDKDLVGKGEVQMSMSDPEDIKFLQEFLDDNNYDVGKIDGVWKALDAKGMKQFQAEMEIPQTGVLDQETASKIANNILVTAKKTQPSVKRTGPPLLDQQKKQAPPKGTRKFPTMKLARLGLITLAVGGLGYFGYKEYQKRKSPAMMGM